MKKYLLGCAVAVAGLTMSQASAQDCCPYQYNSCCDEANFDGFYVGGNLGVFTHEAHRNDRDGFLTDNSGWTVKDTDVTVGVQVGYDWLCCNSVFGLIVDWNWTNNERKFREDPNGTGNHYFRNEFDWFTTIRGRAGLTVCDALVYVTAGAAVARFETTWNSSSNGHFCHRDTRWGWTGGVGAEFLAWCNFSVGAEVLFLHFDENKKSFTNSSGTRYTFGHSDNAWVGRIILNYRFGDLCSLWCCN